MTQKLVLPCCAPKVPVLYADPTIVCWQGSHKLLGAMSLVAYGFYVPLSIMIAPMLMEAAPVRTTPFRPCPSSGTNRPIPVCRAELRVRGQLCVSDIMRQGEAKADVTYVKLYLMIQTIVKASTHSKSSSTLWDVWTPWLPYNAPVPFRLGSEQLTVDNLLRHVTACPAQCALLVVAALGPKTILATVVSTTVSSAALGLITLIWFSWVKPQQYSEVRPHDTSCPPTRLPIRT